MRYRLASCLFVLILKCELSQQQNLIEDGPVDNKGSFDKIVYAIPIAGILIIAIVGCLSYLIYTCNEARNSEQKRTLNSASDKDNPEFALDAQSSTGSQEFSEISSLSSPPPYITEGIDVFNAIVNDNYDKDPPPSYSEAVHPRNEICGEDHHSQNKAS